jgi:prepilin peptidase CpaA
VQLAIYALILIQLIWVSWVDLKTKKISNNWFMINAFLAIVAYITLPQMYHLTLNALILPFTIVMVGFLFYILRIMGAGDSKYLAGLFLLVPIEFHFQFLEELLKSTLFTGAILLISRMVVRFSEIKVLFLTLHWRGMVGVVSSRFSYAPVILLAWILLGLKIWN